MSIRCAGHAAACAQRNRTTSTDTSLDPISPLTTNTPNSTQPRRPKIPDSIGLCQCRLCINSQLDCIKPVADALFTHLCRKIDGDILQGYNRGHVANEAHSLASRNFTLNFFGGS